MRRLTVIIALLAAGVAGAATSSAAILYFTGTATADRPLAPKAVQRASTPRAVQDAPAKAPGIRARKPPSAAKFARIVAGASNKYGQEHSAPQRIRRAQCVQAAAGQYMCSYAVERTGAPSECHLIQARWTPDAASSFTMTLSGRTRRCRTLREALDSLS